MNLEPNFTPARWLTLASVLLTGPSTATTPESQDQIITDRWHVVLIDGSRVGFEHEKVVRRNDRFVTETELKITMRRGSATVPLYQRSTFSETIDGQPLEGTSTLNMGLGAATTTYRFGADWIEKHSAGARKAEQLPPIDGKWLTPQALERHVQDQITQGADRIEARTVDFSLHPIPFDMTMQIVGQKKVEVFGKIVPAIMWDLTQSLMPGLTIREYVDKQGRNIKTTMTLPGNLTCTVLLADEQLAKSKVDPPEIMASTLIHPDRAIKRPRLLKSAIYEIYIVGRQSNNSIKLPRSGFQKVVWGDTNTARVIVDLDESVNPIDDLPAAEHEAHSAMVNHEDKSIQQLVAEAIGDSPDEVHDRVKAQRLREFVHDFVVKKDLSVGFATASDVARTAQGDCTEHAVLLAALLRASGIPSRTASGLIYAEQFLNHTDVFGYHMWTQAWLPGEDDTAGRWVDLDATLKHRDFDAAHITLSVSSLHDSVMANDIMQLAPLVGTLKVKIIESHGGTH